jgi:hypothetical protein
MTITFIRLRHSKREPTTPTKTTEKLASIFNPHGTQNVEILSEEQRKIVNERLMFYVTKKPKSPVDMDSINLDF